VSVGAGEKSHLPDSSPSNALVQILTSGTLEACNGSAWIADFQLPNISATDASPPTIRILSNGCCIVILENAYLYVSASVSQ
jgi:hypothetical protein